MLLRCLVGILLPAAAGGVWAEQRVQTVGQEMAGTVPTGAWKEIQSRDFLVAGNASDKQLRRTAVDLEELRRQVLGILPDDDTGAPAATVVLVFSNRKSFGPFGQLAPGAPPSPSGYVQSGPDLNYIALNADEKNRRALYHAYVHALIRDYPMPLWLREGLAEYYSTLRNERYLVGDYRTVVVGYQVPGYERLLRDPNLLRLSELLEVNEDSPEYDESDPKNVFRAESWALVHLLHKPGMVESLKLFLSLLASGVSQQESFRRALRVDPSLMDSVLRGYIRESKTYGWAHSRTTYCMCRSGPLDWLQFASDRLQADVKERRTRDLSAADIQFRLGDLMLHIGRFPEAAVYLEHAVRLEPKLASAYASLGLLAIMKKDFSQAAESLTRSLSLDPDNTLAHFYRAWLMQQEDSAVAARPSPEKLESMRSALTRAVELSPHFYEARQMLVEVHLLLGRADLNASLVRNLVQTEGPVSVRSPEERRRRWTISVDQLPVQKPKGKNKRN